MCHHQMTDGSEHLDKLTGIKAKSSKGLKGLAEREYLALLKPPKLAAIYESL